MTLSDVIMSLLITSISGCLLGVMTILYKSKCTKISFCGVVIERNILEEEKIDEISINHTTHNLV